MANWKRVLTEEDLGTLGGDTNLANTDLLLNADRHHSLRGYLLEIGDNTTVIPVLALSTSGSGDESNLLTATGTLSLKADGSAANPELRIYDAGGINFSSLRNSAGMTGSISYALPSSLSDNTFLKHTSSGALQWATVETGPDTHIGNTNLDIGSSNRYLNGSGTLIIQPSITASTEFRIDGGVGSSGKIRLQNDDDATVLTLQPSDGATSSHTIKFPAAGPVTTNALLIGNDDLGSSQLDFRGIDSLPPISFGSGSSIPNELGTAPVGDYMFLVHDTNLDTHRKVDFQDIGGALTLGFIQSNIANGYGSEEGYTDPGTGLVGDFNGDGSVTTADLLEFLIAFGSDITDVPDGPGAYDLRYIRVDSAPDTDLTNVAAGVKTRLNFEGGNVTITTGDLDVTVASTDDQFTISSSSVFDITSIPSKKLKFNAYGSTPGVQFDSAIALGQVLLFAKIECLNNTNELVGNEAYFQIADLSSFNASAGVNIANTWATAVCDSPWVEENCGVIGGFSSSNVKKIRFSYYIQSNYITLNSASLRGVQAKLTGQ